MGRGVAFARPALDHLIKSLNTEHMSKRKADYTPEAWATRLAYQAGRNRAWRAAHADELSERRRAEYAADPEKERKRNRAYKASHRDEGREYSRAHRAANIERARERDRVRYAADPDKGQDRAGAWAAANPDKINARNAARRAAKLQRTPSWACPKAIAQVYELAAFCNQIAGPAHVDHEIPLQGELVSGLHVHQNLQVLPGSENCAKRNRFDPGA